MRWIPERSDARSALPAYIFFSGFFFSFFIDVPLDMCAPFSASHYTTRIDSIAADDAVADSSNSRRFRLCVGQRVGRSVHPDPRKRFLSIRNARIFDSSVERGMPSRAAAPAGPYTRPPHACRASSMTALLVSDDRELPLLQDPQQRDRCSTANELKRSVSIRS